jgi:hypothetical protein
LKVIVSRDVTASKKSRPILSLGKILSLSRCPGTMKELLSLCPENLHCLVPLETLVWTNCFYDIFPQKIEQEKP